MATEFWHRNPQRSVRQAIAEGVDKFVFDQALLNYKSQSPHAFMRENFLGTGMNPKYMILGDQGARLYSLFSDNDSPLAVWPVWNPGMEIEVLEEFLANPQGEDFFQCSDPETPKSLRPVLGQEHRVILCGLEKNQTDATVRKYVLGVRELCAEYPDAIAHFSGSYHFSAMFNIQWPSVDWSVDSLRKFGDLQLPNGVRLSRAPKGGEKSADWEDYKDWIELLGYTLDQIRNDINVRVGYHLRAVMWAAENYTAETRIKRRYSPNREVVDLVGKKTREEKATEQRFNWRSAKTIATRALPMFEKADGDKFVCNDCVLRTSCKLARADMVCALKGTEMGDFAKYFGTRDANSIIDGLVKLLEVEADRMQESIEDERGSEDGPSSEVTRQISNVFAHGTALAKLIDPNLNGKGTTITNQSLTINGQPGAIQSQEPRQIVAAIVRALVAEGIPRNEITGDMIASMLRQGGDQQALEGVVVQNTSAKE